MIDTLAIFNELSKTLDPAAARKIAELMGEIYKDVIGRIGETVKELAEAQEKTEQRLERLETVVQRLSEAQEKTEKRVFGCCLIF